MQKLLVTPNIPAELRAGLAAEYVLVERADAPTPASGFPVAVTTSHEGFDAAAMDGIPGLKMIACNGTGTERIDLAAAAKRGIAVCNTPDAVTIDTADFGIGLIYAVLRRLVEGDRFVREGKWLRGRLSPSHRIPGKRLGVVGLGHIGGTVARRAAALGMIVSYTGPRQKPGVAYPYVPDLGDLAAGSDVLILCVPGGAMTVKMISAEILGRMKPDSFLVNICRGSVVDEEALIAALTQKKIAGAGLDVFASEPKLDPRLLEFDNVVVQPHYAAATHETRADIVEDLRQNIRSFFNGGPVRNAAAGPA